MNVDEVFKIIIGHIKEVMPSLQTHDFHESDRLADLGANSVDRSEVLMRTLETLNADIPLMEMARAGDIGELATIVHEKA